MDIYDRRELHQLLLEAFPRRGDLERMAAFGLNQNLAGIADGDNLSDIIFSLIQWARAQNKLDQLINAALMEVPDNPQLHSFAAREGLGYWDAYRKAVAARHSLLTPPSMEANRKVPLADLYVAPRLADLARAPGSDPFTVDALRMGLQRAVLLGPPGGGKSTLALKLCYDLATTPTAHLIRGQAHTPILVVLRDYATRKKTEHCSFLTYIEQQAGALYQLPPTRSGQFDTALREGAVLVCFDGLDELLDTYDRQEIAADIEVFCSQYPTVPVLVTSREVGYDQAPLDHRHFQAFRLSPFDSAQIEEYAQKWFAVDSDRSDETAQSRTQHFLAESTSVADLRTNPLMLGLMCNLYWTEGYIPQNRPDLYEKCATMLFERWDRHRGIHVRQALDPRTRTIMQYLAHWIYTNGPLQEGVTERQLIQATAEYLCPRYYEDADEAQQKATALVFFYRDRAWVFTDVGTRPDGERLYQFTHRTFLEYFTANYLVSIHGTPAALLAILTPRIAAAEWDMVAQLAFGRLAKEREAASDHLLTGLLDSIDPAEVLSYWNTLYFTSRCTGFMVLEPRVLRRIVTSCLEACRTSILQDQDSWGLTTRLVEGLLGATPDNWSTLAKCNEALLIEWLQDPDEQGALTGTALMLEYAEVSLHRSNTWMVLGQQDYDAYKGYVMTLCAKSIYLCHQLYNLDRLSVAEILAFQDLAHFWDAEDSMLFPSQPIPSLAEGIANRLLKKPALDAPRDRIQHDAQHLAVVLLNRPPPWINSSALEIFSFEEYRDFSNLDPGEPNVFFTLFALLAPFFEAEATRSPMMFGAQVLEPLVGVWKLILTTRFATSDPATVLVPVDGLGLSPDQHDFIRRWMRREIDLVGSLTTHSAE